MVSKGRTRCTVYHPVHCHARRRSADRTAVHGSIRLADLRPRQHGAALFRTGSDQPGQRLPTRPQVDASVQPAPASNRSNSARSRRRHVLDRRGGTGIRDRRDHRNAPVAIRLPVLGVRRPRQPDLEPGVRFVRQPPLHGRRRLPPDRHRQPQRSAALALSGRSGPAVLRFGRGSDRCKGSGRDRDPRR